MRSSRNYSAKSRTIPIVAAQDKCMKQKIKASISVPVPLKSLLKQSAARRNLFLHEYIALLLLNDLDPQRSGQVGQSSLSRREAHHQQTTLAGSVATQEVQQ